jgi:hypothetical protein
MLEQNDEQESPSKIVIFCSSWKNYFSFERGKKSFVSNLIPAIFCVFSCCVHCALEDT